jgi:hypothetical protein
MCTMLSPSRCQQRCSIVTIFSRYVVNSNVPSHYVHDVFSLTPLATSLHCSSSLRGMASLGSAHHPHTHRIFPRHGFRFHAIHAVAALPPTWRSWWATLLSAVDSGRPCPALNLASEQRSLQDDIFFTYAMTIVRPPSAHNIPFACVNLVAPIKALALVLGTSHF